MLHSRIIVGIDEVGRGALAGPVFVAGIFCRRPFRAIGAGLGPLYDSKKLSPAKRERWFRRLTRHPGIFYAVSFSTPRVIDRINISQAANRAAHCVYRRLSHQIGRRPHIALLDAGLSLPAHIPHRAVIKGDEKIKLIAAASIIAKVRRDRLMRRLHKKDSRYRFDIHKGYGTVLHRGLIQKHGQSDFHRKSFTVQFPPFSRSA